MNAMTVPWRAHGPAPLAVPPALFRRLSEAELRRVDEVFSPAWFSEGAPVFRSGQTVPVVALVCSGGLREDVREAGGYSRLFGLCLPGEALLLFGPGRSGGQLRALAETEVMTCDRPGFERLAADIPQLRLNLLDVVQEQLSDVRRWQVLLGRKTAAERVASMLLWFHRRLRCPLELELPLSRAEMAQMLGLTLETVSRQIRALARDRVIALPQPARIYLLDHQALAERAGDVPVRRAA